MASVELICQLATTGLNFVVKSAPLTTTNRFMNYHVADHRYALLIYYHALSIFILCP
jgi:hypothetical protein